MRLEDRIKLQTSRSNPPAAIDLLKSKLPGGATVKKTRELHWLIQDGCAARPAIVHAP
jgi:hypothetical protein